MIAVPFRPSYNPVPKRVTRCADALQHVRDEEAEIRVVYKAVDARDHNRCRCCGHKVTPNGGLFWRRVHNHLHKRSTVDRAVKHSRKNVHVLCARCDTLITNDKIRIVGRNCDQALAFVRSPQATDAEVKGIRLRDERSV